MSNNGKTIPADYVFKPGDRVELILETLDSPDYDRFRVGVANFGSWCVMSGAQLRTGRLLPRGLKAGDRVIPKATRPWIATITAVDGEWAWFRYRDNSRGTAPITELELVP